ncbi:MAG: LysE family transporter [Pseudomonadota bacterium]
MLHLFVLGLISGLLLAAPFGPAGALAIRQTLSWGFRGGFACGVGTAVADAIIGGLVSVGIGIVSEWLEAHGRELELVAGAVLIAVGLAAILEIGASSSRRDNGPASSQRLAAAGGQAFFVTIGNPAIAGAFAAMFTAIGLHNYVVELGWAAASFSVAAGIFVGALACWAGFVWIVRHMSGRVADIWLHRVHRGLGIILVVVGASVLIHALAS